MDDTVLVDETHCIEETLEASDCCEAKTQGKNGIGLEDACAEIFFVPTEDDSMEFEPMDDDFSGFEM